MTPISPQCPVCHQADALVSLGTRRDRAPWRFWITWITYLYLCAACHALIEVSEQEMASPRRWARAFTAPGACGPPCAPPARQSADPPTRECRGIMEWGRPRRGATA